MSIYDKSSLVLIPSGTKTGKVFSQKPVSGDGDFTFTRASAATRVNADGNIEKETSNLLLQSNSFSTGSWSRGSSTITTGQSGYDGTNDATLLSATGGFSRIFQDITSFNGVFTASAYVKAGTGSWINFRIQGSNNNQIYFDIANGVLGSVFAVDLIDTSIVNVGNGWYRVAVTLNMPSVSQYNIYIADANGSLSTTNENIYIQDFQVNQGLVAQPYQETTTAAVYGGITDNTPRLDYTDSSCPALLLEPQRTNDVEHSEYFEGSGWGLLQASLTANNSNSPEGLQNAYSFVPNTTNTTHLVYETITKSAGTYTASCFFKADGYDYGNIRLATDSDAKRYSVTIDLTDGTFASQDTYGSPTSTGYKIEDIGNGWYRLSLTSAHSSGFMYHTISLSNVASPTYNNGLPQFAGDGTKGVLIYGAQLELGSYATSYIPCYGSSVTRVIDTAINNNNTSLPTSYPFTLYSEMDIKAIGDEWGVSLLDDSANNKYNVIGVNFQNKYGMICRPNGSSSFFYSNVNATEGTHKICGVFTETTLSLFVDGALIGTTPNAQSFNSSVNDVLIGTLRQVGDTGIRNQIKQALVFNQELSNQEAIDLTTI